MGAYAHRDGDTLIDALREHYDTPVLLLIRDGRSISGYVGNVGDAVTLLWHVPCDRQEEDEHDPFHIATADVIGFHPTTAAHVNRDSHGWWKT